MSHLSAAFAYFLAAFARLLLPSTHGCHGYPIGDMSVGVGVVKCMLPEFGSVRSFIKGLDAFSAKRQVRDYLRRISRAW